MNNPMNDTRRLYVCESGPERHAWAARSMRDVLDWKPAGQATRVVVFNRDGDHWARDQEFVL